jgi:hypothetical protein
MGADPVTARAIYPSFSEGRPMSGGSAAQSPLFDVRSLYPYRAV